MLILIYSYKYIQMLFKYQLQKATLTIIKLIINNEYNIIYKFYIMMYLYIIYYLLLLKIVLPLYDTNISGTTIAITERIGETQTISLPFNFTTYRSIIMNDTYDSNNKIFNAQICKIKQPSIDIEQIDFLYYSDWKYFNDVVITYEEILNEHFLLDLIMFNNLLYVASSNGVFKRISLKSASGKQLLKLQNQTSIKNITNLSQGYFVIVKDKLLFINSNYAFLINQTNITQLKGYEINSDFQTAIYMKSSDAILIGCGIQGVALYKLLDNNTLLFKKCFNQTFFNTKIDISDIATYNESIYVLNRQNGLYKLILDNQNLDATKIIKIKYNYTNCQNLIIQNFTMYLSCPEIHQIELDTDIQTIYPISLYRIKSIIVYKQLIILVGTNLINVYYSGNLIGFYQQFDLDRIIVYNDRIFFGTEYGISMSYWNLIDPVITCGLNSKKYPNIQGKYTSNLKITAECNSTYFNILKLNFSKQLEQQICVYHFPLIVNFWIGSEINFFPLKIVGIVFLIIIVMIIIGWAILQREKNKIQNQLNKYQKLSGDKIPYGNMVEEKQEEFEKKEQNIKGPTEQKFQSQ